MGNKFHHLFLLVGNKFQCINGDINKDFHVIELALDGIETNPKSIATLVDHEPNIPFPNVFTLCWRSSQPLLVIYGLGTILKFLATLRSVFWLFIYRIMEHLHIFMVRNKLSIFKGGLHFCSTTKHQLLLTIGNGSSISLPVVFCNNN